MRRIIFIMVMTVSVGSLLLLIGGFLWGVGQMMSKGANEIPKLPITEDRIETTEDGIYQLVGLGDSLTRGVGDTSGFGYVRVVSRYLEESIKSIKNVQLNNLAVSGSTSRNLLDQLQQDGVQDVISKADMILMTIGGNDLNRSVSLDGENEMEMDPNKAELTAYMERLQQIIKSIRAVNSTAPIYFVGLYNPFSNLEDSILTEGIVMDWNYEVQKLLLPNSGITFVPVADLFQGRVSSLLSSDQFHPNQAGYELMAQRVTQLIAGGTP